MRGSIESAREGIETRRGAWLVAISIPLLAALLVYARVYTAGYVSDDLLVQGTVVPQLSGVRGAFFPPAELDTTAYYRPIVLLSFVWEQRLAKLLMSTLHESADLGPQVLHTVSVLVHTVNTGLVFGLTVMLLANRPSRRLGASIAATGFALNPIHVEAVAWISGRCDLYSTLFVLLAAWLAAMQVRTGRRVWGALSAVPLLLALLSKENAAVYAVILPFFLLALPRPAGLPKLGVADWLPLGIPALGSYALYLFLRAQVSTFQPYGAPAEPITGEKLLGVLAYYISKTFWPWPQSPYVTVVPSAMSATVVLLVVGLVATIVTSRKEWSRHALAAGATWTMVPMAPGLVFLFSPAGSVMAAERILYLPTVGAAFMIATLLTPLLAGALSRSLVLTVSLLVGAAYGIGTYHQSLIWRSDLVFWEANIRDPVLRMDKGVNFSTGMAYLREQRFAEAAVLFRHMLEPGVHGSPLMNPKGERGLVLALLGGAHESLEQGHREMAGAQAAEAVRILDGRAGSMKDGAEFLSVAQEIVRLAGQMEVRP